MMDFDKIDRETQIDILSTFIFNVLQTKDYPMELSEIKNIILDNDVAIRNYANSLHHGQNGDFSPFDMPFGLAKRNLMHANLIKTLDDGRYELSDKGRQLKHKFSINKDVRPLADKHWEECKAAKE